MRRGDIWTASGGVNYAGKPRPMVIVQDDAFDATASITVCGFTTDDTEAPLFRLEIVPSERNGLRQPSRLMVDKITTVAKTSSERASAGSSPRTCDGWIARCWSFSVWRIVADEALLYFFVRPITRPAFAGFGRSLCVAHTDSSRSATCTGQGAERLVA